MVHNQLGDSIETFRSNYRGTLQFGIKNFCVRNVISNGSIQGKNVIFSILRQLSVVKSEAGS